MATEPPPETTASDTHDETTKVAGSLEYDARWPSPPDYARGDSVFAREAAAADYARGAEEAKWRRGIVTTKYPDGYTVVTFDDCSESNDLPPSALRLDDRSDCGVAALMIAAARADAAMVTALLAPPLAPAAAATAIGTRTSRRGCLPLHFAAVGGSATVIGTLLSRATDSTAQVNATQGADGASALYLASNYGHATVVKRLLGAGAAVDQANNNGTTPLSIAP